MEEEGEVVVEVVQELGPVQAMVQGTGLGVVLDMVLQEEAVVEREEVEVVVEDPGVLQGLGLGPEAVLGMGQDMDQVVGLEVEEVAAKAAEEVEAQEMEVGLVMARDMEVAADMEVEEVLVEEEVVVVEEEVAATAMAAVLVMALALAMVVVMAPEKVMGAMNSHERNKLDQFLLYSI